MLISKTSDAAAILKIARPNWTGTIQTGTLLTLQL